MNDSSLLGPAIHFMGALLVLILWGFPSIFLHEIGHTIAAKLIGYRPTHLIVGCGDAFYSRMICGVTIELRYIPWGGLAMSQPYRATRLKSLIYVIAGPLLNLLTITSAALLWHYTDYKSVLAAVIFCESLQVVLALTPSITLYEGISVPSDGEQILRLLFLGRKDKNA